MPQPFQAAALLLDIEGTIGSTRFLTDVLAPYARQHLRAYIAHHRHLPAVARALQDTVALSGTPLADPVETLLQWIAEDRKAPPLKKLQGLVWQRGFEGGDFQGHLYPDAVAALQQWHAEGLPLAIYSSGSVQAQHLYFAHSVAGNARPWFSAHFDTDTGAKVEAASYVRIAQTLGHAPAQILFASDSVAELQAAQTAGLQVVHVVREGTAPDARFASVQSFDELQIQRLP